MASRLGARTARLALSGAHRVSGHGYRHGNLVCLVNNAERTARRTSQSQFDHESVEGALVLSGSPGNAGLLRSVDCRRSDAVDHHDRIDGLPVRGFQSTEKWLL